MPKEKHVKPAQTPLAPLKARTTMVDFQSQSFFAPWPGVAVCCPLEKENRIFLTG